MERPSSSLARNASLLIIFPILGLMVGIAFGVIRTWMWSGDELGKVGYAVSGGLVGSVSGAVAAVAIGLFERRSVASLQKIMGLILVAGILFWGVLALVRTLFDNGSF
jgi:hypothetical protein